MRQRDASNSFAHDADLVAVDAARLLLVLMQFARPVTEDVRASPGLPGHPVVGHFAPQYYLHKLDFLLRYPAYLVYELTELHRRGIPDAADRDDVIRCIRGLLADGEPTRTILPYKRFWYGAYERLDDVESFWHSRALVFVRLELRGDGRTRKHYFVSQRARELAEELPRRVRHARWYADRIALIHRYFGGLSPNEVRGLQYRHETYARAQLQELIPDLDPAEIVQHFEAVFGEPLEVDLEQP